MIKLYPKEARQLLSVGLLLCFFTGANTQSVLYVDDDAPGGGNGSSWATAYNYLQDALAAARSGNVQAIHVAKGTYTPDRGNGLRAGDRNLSFHLVNGVSLIGGYAGLSNPQNPDQRDLTLNQTFLSGDLLGNDQPNWGNYAENSRHVVVARNTDATTLLDGFTITRGYAEWIYPDSSGGGIVIENGNLTIANCVVSNNLAQWGAGVLLLSGAPTFRNCVFSGNYAYIGRGGAMYNVGGFGGEQPHSD